MKKLIAVLISIAVCILAAGFILLKTDRLPFIVSTENGKIEFLSRTVRVTFPEGFSLTQIAERLEENGVCTARDFINAANSEELCSAYPLLNDAENTGHRIFVAEGYLFPNTYDFYRGEAPEKALNRMLSNTEKKITPEIKERAEEMGFSVDEILTVASIIQKEAGIKSEMGKVSSVIYNRLNETYNRLGCDVTVHYLKKFVAPYVENAVEAYGEYYNTYKCYGLPEGPICSPGLDAINAALYPEDTPYKFFCTDKDMNFYYAETYEGHLENCKKAGLN